MGAAAAASGTRLLPLAAGLSYRML